MPMLKSLVAGLGSLRPADDGTTCRDVPWFVFDPAWRAAPFDANGRPFANQGFTEGGNLTISAQREASRC